MSVLHFINPDYPSYTACGLSAYGYMTTRDPHDRNLCGNCGWTKVVKEARKNINSQSTSQSQWKTAVAEEGYYWVSDGSEIEIAYSDGSSWFNNPYDWHAFEEFYVLHYIKIIPPFRP